MDRTLDIAKEDERVIRINIAGMIKPYSVVFPSYLWGDYLWTLLEGLLLP
jgi:hypothetical protein